MVSIMPSYLAARELNDVQASEPRVQFETTYPSRRHRWTLRWGMVAAAVLVALVAGGLVWVAGGPARWDDAWAIVTSPEQIRAWTEGFGAWAPVAFFLAEVAQVIAAPVPGSIFPPVGAAAFGSITALLLCTAGAATGSAIVFAIARKWGTPLIERLVGPEVIDRYARIITARGGLWFFIIMLVPILPDDAVCALVGSSRISFRRFLILSTLGRLPSTVLGIFLTTNLMTNPSTTWLSVALIALIAIALGISKRDRLEDWLLGRAAADR